MAKRQPLILEILSIIALIIGSILVYEGTSQWILDTFGSFDSLEKILIGSVMLILVYIISGMTSPFVRSYNGK